jgi:hypothetical protein
MKKGLKLYRMVDNKLKMISFERRPDEEGIETESLPFMYLYD